MPISADIQMNPNLPRYGLPLDSCVGDAGPSPTEVTNISGPTGAETDYDSETGEQNG